MFPLVACVFPVQGAVIYMLALLFCAAAAAAPVGKPPEADKAGTARWMAANLNWGVVASKSVHLKGVPFGNANSFVGTPDGHLYFYVTAMDTTMQDVAADNHVSFTLSEAGMVGACSIAAEKNMSLPDPEDPTCARLTFSGTMRKVDNSSAPAVSAAMFAKHPQMKAWPTGHEFFFATIDITDIWLIDYYGGAALIDPADYFASKPPSGGWDASSAVTVSPYAAVEDFKMGPPPGPNNTALCPVTGAKIVFAPGAGFGGGGFTPPASLAFKNGQKLWFKDAQSAAAYRAAPRDYWLAPHDKPLPPPDGMRGLPDLRGQTLHCPRSNESMVVAMQTPRVLHRHGQAVYFCCFGCVSAFWDDPTSLFAP